MEDLRALGVSDSWRWIAATCGVGQTRLVQTTEAINERLVFGCRVVISRVENYHCCHILRCIYIYSAVILSRKSESVGRGVRAREMIESDRC